MQEKNACDEDRPPTDLEEALWAAVDHARLYDEHVVAGQLLSVIHDLQNRWAPPEPASCCDPSMEQPVIKEPAA